MIKKTIVCLSLATVLSACGPVNNEQVGSVTGGVLGGLLGSQFGGGAGKVAAAAGGALLGAYLGGHIGQYMDRQDRMEVQHVLETAPVGQAVSWKNPDSGNQYSVKPTRTYYTNKQPCREYVTEAVIAGKKEKIYGKACRQADGTWKVAG